MTALAAGRSACKKWLADRLFFRRFVANACAIHYLTEGEAEASQHWQVTSFVAGNGIVLPKISTKAGENQSRPLYFLFIGRLAVYPKGLDLLIEGLAIFLKSEPDAQLVLHIYGPSDDGSHLQVDALIRELRLEAYVELHSAVYAEEKVAVLNAADIFCHTSRFEGHPMAILEALAYGLPCIASQGTNMAHEIVTSGAGWNAGQTVKEIADALSVAYHQGEQLLGYSIAARQMAEQYSWPERARCALSHYARLAKSN
jgi:glycosyltransferase involved in cell wall biosynthesis